MEEARAGYRDAMQCHLGDFLEYSQLRESISRREKDATRRAATERRDAAEESWAALRPGDVFMITSGRRAGPAVVLDHRRQRSPREANRPMVLTADGQVRRLSGSDVSQPVEPFTTVTIPKGFVAKDVRARRDLTSALRSAVADVPHDQRRRRSLPSEDAEITRLRAEMRQHPCHGCSDREAHARWAERYHRTARQIHDLERRVDGRTNSIAKRFDRVCEILTELGYLTSAGDAAEVTGPGLLLMRLYTESDLLAAQSLLDRDWAALTPPELAAVCSAVVYEARRPEDESIPPSPTRGVHDASADSWPSSANCTSSRPGMVSMSPDAPIRASWMPCIDGQAGRTSSRS